jgi:ABC-2 type transport system permease protein
MIAGFIAGGVVRGIIVGAIVLLVGMLFTGLSLGISNILIILLFAILTALVFALGGLVNAVYAKSFDAINIVPTFVLQPLIYLGGIFYSVHSLPQIAQYVTFINPLFYLINGFRFGFLGFADISIFMCIAVLLGLIAALATVNWYLIRTGLGLKQ